MGFIKSCPSPEQLVNRLVIEDYEEDALQADDESQPGSVGATLSEQGVEDDDMLNQQQMLQPDLDDVELNKALMAKLVHVFLKVEMRGSDIRLDTGDLFRADAYPRSAIDPSKWEWRHCRAFRWRRAEHINLLELRAALHAIQWRCRRAAFKDFRTMMLIDNQAILAVIAKGRSSSKKVNNLLRRLGALCCSLNIYVHIVGSLLFKLPSIILCCSVFMFKPTIFWFCSIGLQGNGAVHSCGKGSLCCAEHLPQGNSLAALAQGEFCTFAQSVVWELWRCWSCSEKLGARCQALSQLSWSLASSRTQVKWFAEAFKICQWRFCQGAPLSLVQDRALIAELASAIGSHASSYALGNRSSLQAASSSFAKERQPSKFSTRNLGFQVRDLAMATWALARLSAARLLAFLCLPSLPWNYTAFSLAALSCNIQQLQRFRMI